jgi:hypothetical protein
VSPSRDVWSDAAVFRNADGALVVEIETTQGAARRVRELINVARAAGIDLVWLHGSAVDAALGFRRSGGFARLAADAICSPLSLPLVPLKTVRELEMACFARVWGHEEPGVPDPTSTYVGLLEGGLWIGICEVDPATGWIDSPGVLPEFRTPERYARLVRGAAACLGGGPATLVTWGDEEGTLAAYLRLGFRPLEYVPGWELNLREL